MKRIWLLSALILSAPSAHAQWVLTAVETEGDAGHDVEQLTWADIGWDLHVMVYSSTINGAERIYFSKRARPTGTTTWGAWDPKLLIANGSRPAIALGPNGTVFIAYVDSTQHVAVATQPSFPTENGVASGNETALSGSRPQIAIETLAGGQHRLHVIYSQVGNEDVRHAYRNLGSSTYTRVTVGGEPGSGVEDLEPRLILGGNPTRALLFAGGELFRLGFDLFGTASWFEIFGTITAHGVAREGGGYAPLTISRSTPYAIRYREATDDDGDMWDAEEHVATARGPSFADVGLAFDQYGSPYINYHRTANGDLALAKRINGNWYLETVHSTPSNVGAYGDIVFDEIAHRMMIAYHDETNGDLRLAELYIP